MPESGAKRKKTIFEQIFISNKRVSDFCVRLRRPQRSVEPFRASRAFFFERLFAQKSKIISNKYVSDFLARLRRPQRSVEPLRASRAFFFRRLFAQKTEISYTVVRIKAVLPSLCREGGARSATDESRQERKNQLKSEIK